VLFRSTHGGATGGPGYSALLDQFLEQTLKGIDHGLEDRPEVNTLGRNSAGATTWSAEEKWPPPATKELKLYLGRKFDQIPGLPSVGPATSTGEYGWLSLDPTNTGGGWAHLSPGTVSEEYTLRDPLNREVENVEGQPVRGHGYVSLFQESAPLAQDVRIAGEAVLDTWVNAAVSGMHITPLLVEVKPDGTLVLVERGFLNLDYRNGLAKAEPAAGWQHAKAEFLPQDYTFTAGSRIGLMLQGSNTVWAVPGNPGVISYAMGPVPNVTTEASSLKLPVVGLNQPAKIFGLNPVPSEVYKNK
jgi:predicted acyl esterase